MGIALLSSGILLALTECSVRRWAPQNAPLVMVRGESLAVPDPILGHRNRPGAVAVQQSPEFHARYAINDDGMRDATSHRRDPRSSTRVLFLGDSFTFGYANEYEDIWPVRL